MEIREATNDDIPMIVALLKLSLGEGLMPKSELYWRWKHVENPFGRSPVLICVQNSELIGVRAFMRWNWTLDGDVYKAVRAVDTATHPGHQGKGIFSKLTMRLVDHCKEMGDHFVFNTPNQQSRPGYLKMGWEEAGKLPIHFSIHSPISIIKNLMFHKAELNDNFEESNVSRFLNHTAIESLIRSHAERCHSIGTALSLSYLKWRYGSVPVARYFAVGDERNGALNGLVIGRIKQNRIGRELRITDVLLKENANTKDLRKQLDRIRKASKIDYTTISGAGSTHSKILGGALTASIGPIVTVRPLGMTELQPFKGFLNWSPSIGDLELF